MHSASASRGTLLLRSMAIERLAGAVAPERGERAAEPGHDGLQSLSTAYISSSLSPEASSKSCSNFCGGMRTTGALGERGHKAVGAAQADEDGLVGVARGVGDGQLPLGAVVVIIVLELFKAKPVELAGRLGAARAPPEPPSPLEEPAVTAPPKALMRSSW